MNLSFKKRFFAGLIYRSEQSVNRLLEKEKRLLFSELKGRILEIGAGTGANMKYYSKEVVLIFLEPNVAMHQYVCTKAEKKEIEMKIITGRAESIPLKDNSVNAVVSTHVLCSVESVKQVLHEVKRVLKPGGTFVFIEHVVAKKGFLRKAQNLFAPFWSWAMDGCQVNRDIKKSIMLAGFKIVLIREKNMPALFLHTFLE